MEQRQRKEELCLWNTNVTHMVTHYPNSSMSSSFKYTLL